MEESSLARRYAMGLIKTISNDSQYKIIRAELQVFESLLNTNEEFKAGMETSLFSRMQKQEMLKMIQERLRLKERTFHFLEVVTEENRMEYLSSMIEALETCWFERINLEKIKVFSAIPLKPKLQKQLTQTLEKSLQKKISLDMEVDPSLIAGIKIQRGTTYYDFSIAGNLAKLRRVMVED